MAQKLLADTFGDFEKQARARARHAGGRAQAKSSRAQARTESAASRRARRVTRPRLTLLGLPSAWYSCRRGARTHIHFSPVSPPRRECARRDALRRPARPLLSRRCSAAAASSSCGRHTPPTRSSRPSSSSKARASRTRRAAASGTRARCTEEGRRRACAGGSVVSTAAARAQRGGCGQAGRSTTHGAFGLVAVVARVLFVCA
eukprot:852840-Prymnesium_polylepis.1